MAFGAARFKTQAAAGAKPPAKKSRYAGVSAAAPRDPIPHVGEYRFRVMQTIAGHNPGKGTDSYKISLEIVELDEVAAKNHAKGDIVFVTFRTGGNGAASGLARTKSFVMGSAGYEDEAEYDKFDPQGLFIDSTSGEANLYSEANLGIAGRLVDCMVTRGNATADGVDYYREFSWAVVPENEQEAEGGQPRPEIS